jgi:hypothetical protein
MPSEAEIEACPFCGGKAEITRSMSWTNVWCPSCAAAGPRIHHGGPTDNRMVLNRCEAEAISAWNTRALSAASAVRSEGVVEREDLETVVAIANRNEQSEAGDRLAVQLSSAPRLSVIDSRLRHALQNLVTAWEATMPGDTTVAEIQRWLVDDMKPAIDDARAALSAITSPVQTREDDALRRLIRNVPSIIEDHVCGGSDTRPVVDIDGLVGALTENVSALLSQPEPRGDKT